MDAGKHDPHVPIFISSNLAHAKRIIVFFGESIQDLGIFAYRTIGQKSIADGSAINFVNDILTTPDPNGETPAVILANMGQLLWSNRCKRAMTSTSFLAIPQKTAVDHTFMIDEVRNRVPGNTNQAEHVKYVFEKVIQTMVHPEAMLDIIGIDDGAAESVEYLQANRNKWEKRIQAIAIGIPWLWRDRSWDEGFTEFWGKVRSLPAYFISGLWLIMTSQRARVYMVSPEPLGTPLTGRKEIGCNCYSSGSAQHLECIMPEAYRDMLAFFRLVNELPGYEEVEVILEDDMASEQASDHEVSEA